MNTFAKEMLTIFNANPTRETAESLGRLMVERARQRLAGLYDLQQRNNVFDQMERSWLDFHRAAKTGWIRPDGWSQVARQAFPVEYRYWMYHKAEKVTGVKP